MGAAWVVQQPFDAIVLVVTPGVVLGQHLRVAERDLPEDDPLLGDGGEGLEEAGVTSEIGSSEPGRAAIAVNQLLETGVAVAEFGKSDIEVRAEGVVEVASFCGEGIGGGVVRLADLDIDAGAPDAHVVAEDDVRGILVSQLNDRLGHAGEGIGETCDVGHAGASDLHRDGCGVVARGALFEKAPHVGLDVKDDLVVRERAGLLEEELEVVVVGAHGRGVLEVVVDAFGFALRSAGCRLADLVVGEHGRDAVRDGILDVVRGERAVGVPVRPAVAGVHACSEVLITEGVRCHGFHGGGTTGAVGMADLERRGPAGGQDATCFHVVGGLERSQSRESDDTHRHDCDDGEQKFLGQR